MQNTDGGIMSVRREMDILINDYFRRYNKAPKGILLGETDYLILEDEIIELTYHKPNCPRLGDGITYRGIACRIRQGQGIELELDPIIVRSERNLEESKIKDLVNGPWTKNNPV